MPHPTIVIAPDSYKGSVSAKMAAQALASGLQRTCPQARLVQAPMADGGEGTLDCIAAAIDGRWHSCRLEAIHGTTMRARWYETADHLAVIESAQILGLPLIETNASAAPPLPQRSSHALGVLLRKVLDSGARRVLIGLGGSACNDAGLGLLAALGCVARDRDGRPVSADMNGLVNLHDIACAGLDSRLAETDIRLLCDVDNPLLGARSASRIYGPQKGLAASDIDAVDAACERLAQRMQQHQRAQAPFSGAAGGLGFALAAIGAQLLPGADTLIDQTGLRARLAGADRVITGEGRSDLQTLSGKLPLAIARASAPVPTLLVSGAVSDDARHALERVFVMCPSLSERAGNIGAALREPRRWLHEVGRDLGRGWPDKE